MTDAADGASSVCFRCLVSGRVQGVFFRGSTREQAERLGVSGHAHNLPDGRVEVLACGSPDAVRALRAWLQQGPAHAQVTHLDCEQVAAQPLQGFSTG
ncbi:MULTISPECIES: acylphosphatase [Thiorhodovibrio]|uniref:acylphosphatase n=1 Tax=Thiorhodovibrio TaxID=61593 RepID=UPI001912757B|nr:MULTISPECIES: acylphosphatase [Thiorhodovibrio]MBK5967676.1 acylphosphatase [Thiorhodovibrio winogradskyi]WPL11624.1 Acylphosphatase [Thiorhodovibrio litoralis]